MVTDFEHVEATAEEDTSDTQRQKSDLTVSHLALLLVLLSVRETDIKCSQNLIKNAIKLKLKQKQLECGPMPNVTAALPNIGGALCSTSQSLADAHY